jgi:hypothetical protein
MKLDFKAKSVYTNAYWPTRLESADSVADRYIRFADTLAPLHPCLGDLITLGNRRAIPFATARRDLTKIVKQKVIRDDDGNIEPLGGFMFTAYTSREPGYEFSGVAGSAYQRLDSNRLQFSTTSGYLPEPSMMAFDVFHAATLATIACWQPLFCLTQPSTLRPHQLPGLWFDAAWFTYIHPSLLPHLRPPDVPVIEPTPDGGLLLGAATETLDPDNPAHLAAALRIGDATRHLSKIISGG